MIAVDTSSFTAYWGGSHDDDARLIDNLLNQRQIIFPPMVVTELLSDPALGEDLQSVLKELPLLEIKEGFWYRAGLLRNRVLKIGCKAKLADTLISQSCLDHDVSLITRDRDFLAFAEYGGLKLVG